MQVDSDYTVTIQVYQSGVHEEGSMLMLLLLSAYFYGGHSRLIIIIEFL